VEQGEQHIVRVFKTTLRTAGLVNLTHTFEKKGAENTANVKGELLLTEGTREGKVARLFFRQRKVVERK